MTMVTQNVRATVGATRRTLTTHALAESGATLATRAPAAASRPAIRRLHSRNADSAGDALSVLYSAAGCPTENRAR